jgi:acyl-CoA synthetase (AMP-forming)/AMP-acid ligase II
MAEWTIGAILDAIAETVPDRPMRVYVTRRSTFGESADRTRRLANFLAGRGFGAHREREELQNWECGQDRVALIMHNDLYPDMVIGCLKARTVPANVNYNYTPREVAELLETFPVVEGQRVVISGDRGSLAPDGTMRLFGRDSLVINTGGEKGVRGGSRRGVARPSFRRRRAGGRQAQ